MYRCLECGNLFEVLHAWAEPYGQSFYGSPCCHEDFEEVSYCECGNIKEPYHEYCSKCEGMIELDNERV